MKLVLAIVSNDDSSSVSAALNKENFQVTRLATTGGFLRAGNTTLIIGVDDDRVDACLEIIGNEGKKRTEVVPSTASYDIGRYASFPVEVQVGGATVFVMDVEAFHKL
ncbi:transcriptional regulator [Erysipelothrix sp. HDW6C]|uniref:cyclic-di-AMP receptor n=1 Tax=Erysipelothrix sp. HDW6C TaxID=2714930 RepID=UPI001408C0DF|nr:cyclic-di-AMP receptor [Erysipelothrix sp. HDW6C]QIK69009.1 transcriptional regulator [Erysipelothrix sp. HDW6C]